MLPYFIILTYYTYYRLHIQLVLNIYYFSTNLSLVLHAKLLYY